MKRKIRQIINDHAHLAVRIESLQDSDNLYSSGMTSHSSVVLMLALENEFGLEFPPALMNRNAFESIDAIVAVIDSLVPAESR